MEKKCKKDWEQRIEKKKLSKRKEVERGEKKKKQEKYGSGRERKKWDVESWLVGWLDFIAYQPL